MILEEFMTLRNRCFALLMRSVYKKIPKLKEYKQSLSKSVEKSGVIRQGHTIVYPSYKKLFYCDKSTGEGFFFRCKAIKDKGKYPVIIFHHGNGLHRAGKNNRQMDEFTKLIKKLNQNKCHQVAIHLDAACEYNTPEHSRALDGFIEYLQNTYNNVDFDRIYLAGISHGGYACVYEVLRNPDKYAAVVISMAYTFDEKLMTVNESYRNPFIRNLTDEDFKTLSGTPFYISWAKDDSVVITESNEKLSKNLKEKNKYYKEKIYQTGGHRIAYDFFKNSDWDTWLFALSNQNK